MNAYDLVQYGDKIQKIFAEFQVKLDEKIKGDRTFTNDNYISFVNSDPTDKKIYLRWIIDSYINGGIKLYEDLLSRVKPALQDYDYLKQAGHLQSDQKIVENYCGIAGCTKKFKEKPGLESLIDSYKDQLESRRLKLEETAEIKSNTEKVFESDELYILHPKTEAASCYYGKGTKWCTAATQGENMFEQYNRSSPLYIIIPKKASYEGEKYQMHVFSRNLMDEKDEQTDVQKILKKYSSLYHFLPFRSLLFIKAVEKGDTKTVQKFLSDRASIDPSENSNKAIGIASENGHLEIVRLLLADDRVDPSGDANYAIQMASQNGHVEVVRLLLADGRADPSANDNKAIRKAIENEHIKVVKLLLADGRVDPSADDNYAIREASALGNTELLNILLADKRVDPTAGIWHTYEND